MTCIAIFAALLLISAPGIAQELEPRSLTNVPTGTNFAMMVYGFASGNILFDPALPLEDVNARIHSIAGVYVRSFNFLGMGAKSNIVLPYAHGNWDGNYLGIDTALTRSGMADLRLGFSFNFIGSPALEKDKFSSYSQKTIAGFSFQMVAPTGQYFDDKLINIGSKRWAFRPQLGISHKLSSWFIEYYLNVWLYTTNSSFLVDNTLKQKPIGALKVHVIKSFKKGIWAAVGAAYAHGGRTFINDEKRDSNISVLRYGAVVAVPVHPQHSFKLKFTSTRRFEQGPEFEAISLSYQFIWF